MQPPPPLPQKTDGDEYDPLADDDDDDDVEVDGSKDNEQERLVYQDQDLSAEEKRASLPRYSLTALKPKPV